MKKNAGFGIVGIIAIAAAIIIVGLIGWRLYEANKPKQNNSSSQTNNTDSDNNSQQGSPSEETPNLTISELGVRIKLDDKTKNVTYAIAQSSSDAAFIIDPTIKELSAAYPGCTGETAGMIGLLDRSKDPNHWGEAPITVDNVNTFKIGDYYYNYRAPQAECTQDSEISSKRAAQSQHFMNTLKTITASN